MVRKILCLFLGICLIWGQARSVCAAEQGSVQVNPQCGGDLILGGNVTLYRVGEPVLEGFRLTDGLANWIVADKDAVSAEFVQWIVSRMHANGKTQQVRDASGAFFSGLAEGLYLVIQTGPVEGYASFNPFLVEIPGENGQLAIQARPKVMPDNPKTGDAGIGLPLSLAVFSAAMLILLFSRPIAWDPKKRK